MIEIMQPLTYFAYINYMNVYLKNTEMRMRQNRTNKWVYLIILINKQASKVNEWVLVLSNLLSF